MASGHFDPIHPGHINYLLAAKNLGGKLIVVVDSDESLDRKHPKLLSQIDRAGAIAALSFVDTVILSTGLDISAEIVKCKPDVYAIGPDHSPSDIPEYITCQDNNVQIDVLDDLVKEKPGSYLAKLKMVYSNRPTVVSAIVVNNKTPIVGVRNMPDNTLRHDLIGGFVEPGETLEQALSREVYEETNSNVIDMEYFGSWSGKYDDGRILLCVVFVCKLDSDPTPTNEMLSFIEVDSVPDDMFSECDAIALQHYFNTIH